MTYEALPPTGAPSTERPRDEADRGLLVLNYIFLLVAPFTLHVLAIVAVILAYVRRPNSPPFEAGHYGLQIRVFWWSVILFVVAVLLGLVAIGAGLGAFWQSNYEDAWAPHWGGVTVAAIIGACLAWFASFVVAVVGALVGMIKLLSNEPARRNV